MKTCNFQGFLDHVKWGEITLDFARTHENSRIEHFFEDFALGGHAKLSDLEDVLQGLQPKISRLSKNGSCQRKSPQETGHLRELAVQETLGGDMLRESKFERDRNV